MREVARPEETWVLDATTANDEKVGFADGPACENERIKVLFPMRQI
jgi:hypothetical protein